MTYASLMKVRANPRSYITEPGMKPPHTAHALDNEFDNPNGTDATTLGFSWVNQGASTAVVDGGALTVTAPSGGNAYNNRVLVKTAPSTPYTVTTRLSPNASFLDFNSMGLALRESTSGRMLIWMFEVAGNANTAWNLVAQRATNATTFSANQLAFAWRQPRAYLRVADDGTDLLLSASLDGRDFVQFYSEARTTFVNTPNQIGLTVNRSPIAGVNTDSFDFFRVDWSFDFDAYADR